MFFINGLLTIKIQLPNIAKLQKQLKYSHLQVLYTGLLTIHLSTDIKKLGLFSMPKNA